MNPPAVAAYAVRWMPSVSAGVIGYRLEIRDAGADSGRSIDIPLSATRTVGTNVLRYEISLETDRDHILSLRAYDASTLSPPSNQVAVRASMLIANALAAAPFAATASTTATGAEAGSSAPASSAPTATSTEAVAPAQQAAASDEDASTTADFENDLLASIEFDGAGDHLEGRVSDLSALDLGGVDGLTLAAWLRPVIDDAARRVVVSIAADDDAGFDRVELALVDGGHLELVLRDSAGQIVRQDAFAAGLRHDVWQHVALVVDVRAQVPFTLLVDGVPAAGVDQVSAATSSALDEAVVPGVLRVGAGASGDGFIGRIGHVAVWSRALEAGELVFAGVRGHTLDLRDDAIGMGLAHYWRLGEGEAGFEIDLGSADLPVDLAAALGDLVVVEDAPLSLE